jgi:adenine-specific DNA-methyltransferase
VAKIDDLIDRIEEPELRQQINVAVAELQGQKTFGFVFERHLPEGMATEGGVRPGRTVRHRTDKAITGTVTAIDLPKGIANVDVDGESLNIPIAELLIVRRFGEPIYPALESTGQIERKPAKPFHIAIEGENFHALQMLAYTHTGKIDCIYLDPPYNSGAKDWKYNNDYVDDNDRYRHSKWLSFMERRLQLCRPLLTPNGVLIVTIDHNEVHRLGVLLAQVFPSATIQMVTIVINPKGVTEAGFSRVDEYAYFVFFGLIQVRGAGDDLLTPAVDAELTDSGPRWKGLLRSGDDAQRSNREGMFYPVLIDAEQGRIIRAGEVLPPNKDPKPGQKIDGCTAVWPIRSDKTLGRWGVGPDTLNQLIELGYVSLGKYDAKRRTWAVSYLSEQFQMQIQAGILQVTQRDQKTGTVVVKYVDASSPARRLKTVWHRTSHDAGAGGTDLLNRLMGGRPFPFRSRCMRFVTVWHQLLRN